MSELVTLEEAAKRLGKGYSRSSILRRIQDLEWIEGVHYVDDRRKGTKLRRIKINLAAIEAWRKVPARDR